MTAPSNNDSERDKRIQRLESMLREQRDEIDRLRAQSGKRQSSFRSAGQPARDTRSGMRSGERRHTARARELSAHVLAAAGSNRSSRDRMRHWRAIPAAAG